MTALLVIKEGGSFFWMNEQGDKHGARLCSRAYMKEWEREKEQGEK